MLGFLTEPKRAASTNSVRPAGDGQFLEQRSHMRLDSVQRQHEMRRDLLVGIEPRQQPQHVGLAYGQRDDEESPVRAGFLAWVIEGRVAGSGIDARKAE